MTHRSASSLSWLSDQPPPRPPTESHNAQQLDHPGEPTIAFDRPGEDVTSVGNSHSCGEDHNPIETPPQRDSASAATVTIRPAWDVAAAGTRPAATPLSAVTVRKILVVALFWAILVATLCVWWFNTPTRDVLKDRQGVFLAAGQITGLISGFLLLAAILTKARLRWIDSSFGAHELRGWHRTFCGALVLLVVAHSVLLVFATAWKTKEKVFNQAWLMLTTMEGLIGATIATLLVALAALFSTRLVRRRVSYEFGHAARMGLYLALFLGYSHQFALGSTMLGKGLARWYWIGLHLCVLGCLLWGRVLRPAWFNSRHEFRVVDVAEEIPGWLTVDIGGRQMEWVHAEAGQYVYCRFLNDDCFWQSHPFSISAVPNGEWLRIRVKAVGSHTQALQNLEPDVDVLLSEPTGSCTASRRTREQALLIVSGTGIAPTGALLTELPVGTVVLYHASSESELEFSDELESIARKRETKLHFVIGGTDEHGRTRAFSPTGLRELVDDVVDRDVYVLGPQWLVEQSTAALRWLRVPHRQVHCESFEM